MRNTFKKNEKLKSKNAFAALFKNGSSAKFYPIRVVYIKWPIENSKFPQVGFSVSKRKFKKAVDRNRIKRLLREAYRLNKIEVLTNLQHNYAVLFIYLHHQENSYKNINDAVVLAMKHIAKIDADKMNENN